MTFWWCSFRADALLWILLLATIALLLPTAVRSDVEQQQQQQQQQQHDVNVLMFGNSYTSVNNLVGMLKAMYAENNSLYNPQVFQSYCPGAVIFYHHAQYIRNRTNPYFSDSSSPPNPNWDFVVLQEQSRLGGMNNHYSNQAAVALDRHAMKKGSKSIFYMTWGRRNGETDVEELKWYYPDFLTMNRKLLAGYRRYVSLTSTADRVTVMAPVGLAFQYIYEEIMRQNLDPLDPSSDFYKLYASDGSHPSLRGSYLAACVLFATMTRIDPRTLQYRPSGLTESERDALQSAAYFTASEEFELSDGSPPTTTVTTSPTKSPTGSPVTSNPTRAPTVRPTKLPNVSSPKETKRVKSNRYCFFSSLLLGNLPLRVAHNPLSPFQALEPVPPRLVVPRFSNSTRRQESTTTTSRQNKAKTLTDPIKSLPEVGPILSSVSILSIFFLFRYQRRRHPPTQ